ncbi:MAG: ribosomal RNA small subunit methyltransferase A [Verrucomicrobia bacterium]|nr:ribosomal RNA small subunit methyltransferase A [Verrucomicrobiota bacterium]
MTLSEMRRWMEARDHRVTKSLGQNFLHDRNQLNRIAEAAQVTAGDRVLEIGPGLGPLTAHLLERGAEVTAVEIDERLVAVLRDRFSQHPHFNLFHADALEWIRDHRSNPNLPTTTPAAVSPESLTSLGNSWKVASNLPYSTGSPMLVELASVDFPPHRIAATLQWEVVQRIGSRPRESSYGLLTLLLGLRYRCAGHFKIPARCFFPEPGVTSACVTLIRRDSPLLPRPLEGTFARVVKRAFSQRRKMMKNLLKQDWPEESLSAALTQAGIPATARAEEIDLDRFAHLAQLLHSRT